MECNACIGTCTAIRRCDSKHGGRFGSMDSIYERSISVPLAGYHFYGELYRHAKTMEA